MRTRIGLGLLALSLVFATACGKIVQANPDAGTTPGGPGAACAGPSDCDNGICAPDGVCCDRACDATCEACVLSKTGTASGTCAAVTNGTDPDQECADQGPDSCGTDGTCNGQSGTPACHRYLGNACNSGCVNGTVTAGSCDGLGTCQTGSPQSCGDYQCDATGTSCLTTCASNNDCIAADFCNSAHACAKRLKIAMVAGSGSCLYNAGSSYLAAQALLQARGHTATIVLDTDIASAAAIAQYDVVILGGPGDGCTNVAWSTYDAFLPGYVQNGGGLVAAGWTLFNASLNSPSPAPGLLSVMPTTGAAYFGDSSVAPVSGTILDGLAAFNASEFLPYGGSPQGSATVLMESNGTSVGFGWTVGNGRSVYLGPMYFENCVNSYTCANLTDGTQPSSVEALLRSIEWAGHSL